MRANGHHAAHRGNQHVDCSRLGQEALESTPSSAVGCVSEASQIEKFFLHTSLSRRGIADPVGIGIVGGGVFLFSNLFKKSRTVETTS